MTRRQIESYIKKCAIEELKDENIVVTLNQELTLTITGNWFSMLSKKEEKDVANGVIYKGHAFKTLNSVGFSTDTGKLSRIIGSHDTEVIIDAIKEIYEAENPSK